MKRLDDAVSCLLREEPWGKTSFFLLKGDTCEQWIHKAASGRESEREITVGSTAFYEKIQFYESF
jgi:hypothetical protein